MSKKQEGFIYIYKCVVGNVDDICKIGKTTHFRDKHCRIVQSVRTPYYGFMPYMSFDGDPIVTAFRVKDVDAADTEVQNYFKKKQVSSLEIYVVDYMDAIRDLYNFLLKKKQLIEFIPDGISNYDSIRVNKPLSYDTTKFSFEHIKQELLSKYSNGLPEQLLSLLRDEQEFSENCSSHFKSGNYVIFPNNLVLDIHCNKPGRTIILNKLLELL